jgi:hypothetical protein
LFTTSDTATLAPWSLTLTLNGTSPPIIDGQQCILDLTFEAYQEGGAVGTEYHDTEHVTLLLTADPPVIAPMQTQSFGNLDQGQTPPPPAATSTGATSTDPVVTDPTPPDPVATTTENVILPVPEDAPPPVDETVTPPTNTPPPTDVTPPADTSTTDTPPPGPAV